MKKSKILALLTVGAIAVSSCTPAMAFSFGSLFNSAKNKITGKTDIDTEDILQKAKSTIEENVNSHTGKSNLSLATFGQIYKLLKERYFNNPNKKLSEDDYVEILGTYAAIDKNSKDATDASTKNSLQGPLNVKKDFIKYLIIDRKIPKANNTSSEESVDNIPYIIEKTTETKDGSSKQQNENIDTTASNDQKIKIYDDKINQKIGNLIGKYELESLIKIEDYDKFMSKIKEILGKMANDAKTTENEKQKNDKNEKTTEETEAMYAAYALCYVRSILGMIEQL